MPVLDEFYTKMINLFSQFNTPEDIRCFGPAEGTTRGIFPVIGRLTIGDIELEVLDGLGGHTHGQVFLYAKDHGLLFTADSVINFASLTKRAGRLQFPCSVSRHVGERGQRTGIEGTKGAPCPCTGDRCMP